MDYRDKLLSSIAHKLCSKIGNKVIWRLQRMKSGLLGEDSSLENAWDEICVQIQGERSFYWETYEDTIRIEIAAELEKLHGCLKQAIWLQTDEGFDWSIRDSDEDVELDGIPDYNADDISFYILSDYVLDKAGDWTSKRIGSYLDPD